MKNPFSTKLDNEFGRRAGIALAALFLFVQSGIVATRASETAALGVSTRSYSSTAAAISAERIKRHVDYLASDELQGRRAGTPYADKAAQYIEGEFRRYGLSPAAQSGFLEPFSFVSDVLMGGENVLRVTAAGSSKLLKPGEEFVPLAFSSTREAQGPVVFAGYGISAPELQYDDYAGADLTGKIVLIMRGGPDGDNPHGKFADYTAPGRELEFKTLKAKEKGAVAVVFIGDKANFSYAPDSQLPYDLNFLDAGIAVIQLGQNAARSVLALGDISHGDLEKQLAGAAPARLLQGTTIQIKTSVKKIEGKTSNVVGVIRGSDPHLSSQYIVIGAHYDHLGMGGPESLAENPYGKIHHGADDNASGVAALLELARVLSLEKSQLKRSVILASFSGEEEGLLGSAAFTRQPPVPLEAIVAMLNMDMVGRLRERNLVVGGAGTSPAWKPLLDRLNRLGPAGEPVAAGTSPRFKLSLEDDGYGPSDHQSFYIKDIPVLFFFTGSHDDYHKPSDTADKVNSNGVSQVAEFVREAVVLIDDAPDRIAFSKVKRDNRQTVGGFRVYLGTVPNYSEQSNGLKLDGVRPSSPAERAGLQAGDIVVKLGTMDVKNVYDYTYALEGLRAGQEVEMVIRRGGQLMTLKITPEKRN
ncbi:MAG TPA: M28 family peptidase [Blastocatellia bacterium]